jgi:catechol 2,3-dioxygenase-like lactoylglutathione lyase family enzyme
MSKPAVAALEFTVRDLDQCLSFLVDALGFPLEYRNRHPQLDAEVATVNAGRVLINLVSPADTGTGIPLEDTDSRMSQLNIVVPTEADAVGLKARLVEAGASVVERNGLFFVDTSMTEQLFGVTTAFVMYANDAGDQRGSPEEHEDDPAPGFMT